MFSRQLDRRVGSSGKSGLEMVTGESLALMPGDRMGERREVQNRKDHRMGSNASEFTGI